MNLTTNVSIGLCEASPKCGQYAGSVQRQTQGRRPREGGGRRAHGTRLREQLDPRVLHVRRGRPEVVGLGQGSDTSGDRQ